MPFDKTNVLWSFKIYFSAFRQRFCYVQPRADEPYGGRRDRAGRYSAELRCIPVLGWKNMVTFIYPELRLNSHDNEHLQTLAII